MAYTADIDFSPEISIPVTNRVQTKNRNYTIDAFRLLGAFCVVLIHTPSFGNLSGNAITIINELSRWAVPFFFIVSGYYFEMGYRNNPELTFLKRIKSLLAVFFTSNFIYLVFLLIRHNQPIGFLLNVSVFLIGTHDHLWFIGSMLFGFIFLWFMLNIKAIKMLPYLIVATLGIVLVTGGYARFLLPINVNFRFARHLMSIPFLTIGYLFSRYNLSKKVNITQGLLLIVAGVIIQAFEQNYIFKYTRDSTVSDLLIGTVLFAFGAFIFALKVPMSKTNLITRLGQEYSLIIYLYHPIVLSLFFTLVIPRLGAAQNMAMLLSPLIVFVITLFGVILMRKYLTGLYQVLNGTSWRKVKVSPALRTQ